jgi:hypothetical protein
MAIILTEVLCFRVPFLPRRLQICMQGRDLLPFPHAETARHQQQRAKCVHFPLYVLSVWCHKDDSSLHQFLPQAG